MKNIILYLKDGIFETGAYEYHVNHWLDPLDPVLIPHLQYGSVYPISIKQHHHHQLQISAELKLAQLSRLQTPDFSHLSSGSQRA